MFGCTEAALNAGISVAIRPATSSVPTEAATVHGSIAGAPSIQRLHARPSPHATTRPSIVPASTSVIPLRTTMPTTRVRSAPSASRNAISRRLRLTT